MLAPVLFGDAAAPFILCNEPTPEARSKANYSLVDSTVTALPDSTQDLEVFADLLGKVKLPHL
jgi:hypothetical protein